MTKYRKKPIVVEAVIWDETVDTFNELQDKGLVYGSFEGHGNRPDWVGNLRFKSTDGWTGVAKGEYIVKGPRGEFYRCRPEVFTANHEAVEG